MGYHLTKSGVRSQQIRRLKNATDMKYTEALRMLEVLKPEDREQLVLDAEKKKAEDR